MDYKRLYIWVEGADDIRFFEKIIKPRMQEKYDLVEIIPYAGMDKNKFKRFLRSIHAMGAEYIYVKDINDTPCVTCRKSEIREKITIIEENRINIVIKEIEGWYLAGLDDENSRKLKIKILKDTESIDKNHFNALIPKRYDSRIDFMIEILKYFSNEIAVKKNGSFKYFTEKYKL